MMISTKGRYALRVMIDIAEHQHDGYIPLKEIANVATDWNDKPRTPVVMEKVEIV